MNDAHISKYFQLIGGFIVACTQLEFAILCCGSIAQHRKILRSQLSENINEMIQKLTDCPSFESHFPKLAAQTNRIVEILNFRNNLVHGTIAEFDETNVVLHRLRKEKLEPLVRANLVRISYADIVRYANELSEVTLSLMDELTIEIEKIKQEN